MVRNYKRKTEDRWSKEDLLEALLSIYQGHLKVNDAAKHYGISRATLYRQYMKFIDGGASCDVNQFRTCGGSPILTKMEEDVLETTIKNLRDQGFTVEAGDIKRICFEYCDTNGIDNQFNVDKRMASDDWYYGFLKRHPGVKLSRPYKKRSEEASSSGPGTSASASVTSATDKSGEALKDGVINTAPANVSRPPDKPKQPAAIILTASPVKKRKKRSAAGGTQPGTDSKRAKKGPADEVKSEIDAEDLKTEDDQMAEGTDKAKEDEQAGVEGLDGQGGRDDQSESDESDEGEETEENSGTSDDSEDEESGGDSE